MSLGALVNGQLDQPRVEIRTGSLGVIQLTAISPTPSTAA